MKFVRTFGHLVKSKQEANKLKGLARLQGWDKLCVVKVDLGHGVIRYKLTGIPWFTIISEMHGTHGSETNSPRVVNPKRRKGQAYRQ